MRTNGRARIGPAVLIALLTCATLLLGVGTATAVKIDSDVIAAGGEASAGGSIKAMDTVGQSAIGERAEGGSLRGYDGFWLGLPSINVPVEGNFFGTLTAEGTAQLRWMLPTLMGIEALNVYRSMSEDSGYERINTEELSVAAAGVYEDATVWPQATFWYELRARFYDGHEEMVGYHRATVTTEGRLAFAFRPPSPNPCTNSTTLSFDVPQTVGAVRLSIYNVQGRLVRTVVDRPMSVGRYEIPWDARDERGSHVASGVYFATLTAGENRSDRKLLVIR